MDSIVLVVIVVVLVLVLAAAGLVMARRRRSDQLRRHFGSEYERTVAESGDRKAAEAELADRERRHRDLDIRTLRPEERDGYRREWESVQAGFVDDPAGALREADALVVEVMRTRGYPVDDFDRRAEDISVAHPEVVHHYREARAVHDAAGDGGVDTERQRHALTSYRSLVDALLGHGDGDGERDGVHPGRHAATSGTSADGQPTESRTSRTEEQAR
jgi:hypothetical protein